MRTIDDFQACCGMPPMAATIGMFDGVHRGHRLVIDYLRREASARGLQTAVVTFTSHPQSLFHPDSGLRLLTSAAKKVQLLAQSGVDYTLLLPFTRELSVVTAADFMAQLRRRCNVRLLVVGYDHHFGRRADGESFADYCRYGKALGMDVVAAPALTVDAGNVSSSAIRRLLSEGDVRGAEEMLGRRYTLDGTVVGGRQNGRLIGFPTANIDLGGEPLLVPADGVYATEVTVGGVRYGGMLNIGTPTVDGATRRTIEVNIFDFDRDIYGASVDLEFVARVRDERRMAGLDDLCRQLTSDRQTIKEILTQSSEYENH